MTNTFTTLFGGDGESSGDWYFAQVTGAVEDATSVKVAELGPDGLSSPTTALLATEVLGDYTAPLEGDVCLVIELGNVPMVVGVLGNERYSQPAHGRRERVINHRHSETELRIKEDGTVVIDAESIEFGDGDDQKPVARVGDAVSVSTSSGNGSIQEGSDITSSE